MSQIKENLDTAAPPISEVVQEITTAAKHNSQTNEKGLQKTSVSDESNADIIGATVLNNTSESTVTSALTQYMDVQNVESVDIPFEGAPISDPVFAFPKGYFDVAERSFGICTVKIDNGDPTGLPLMRIDIANALLSQDFVAQKFAYPLYIRYNLEVQVRMLATNFHYGQIMVVWRPAMAPICNFDWSVHPDHYEAVVRNYCFPTAYDWIWTASQLPHKVMSITAGSTVTMSCPWTLNRQYAPTRSMLSLPYHPGYLDIYLLTPVLPTDIDRPALQVFARFTDVCGFGYRAVNSSHEPMGPPMTIKYIAKPLANVNWRTLHFTQSSELPLEVWCANSGDPQTVYDLGNYRNAHYDGSDGVRWRFLSSADVKKYVVTTTWRGPVKKTKLLSSTLPSSKQEVENLPATEEEEKAELTNIAKREQENIISASGASDKEVIQGLSLIHI